MVRLLDLRQIYSHIVIAQKPIDNRFLRYYIPDTCEMEIIWSGGSEINATGRTGKISSQLFVARTRS